MGMNLDVEAFFGWEIGQDCDIEQNKDSDLFVDSDYIDPFEISEKLKVFEIETSSYYDEQRYFVRLKSVESLREDDGTPIKFSDLPLAKYDASDVGFVEEKKKLEHLFNIKLEGIPQWIFTCSYS